MGQKFLVSVSGCNPLAVLDEWWLARLFSIDRNDRKSMENKVRIATIRNIA
jgi:hypothetical protein